MDFKITAKTGKHINVWRPLMLYLRHTQGTTPFAPSSHFARDPVSLQTEYLAILFNCNEKRLHE